MGFEDTEKQENIKSSKLVQNTSMTLEKAVEMGEYNPDFLATFPEWHTISRHVQFEYIRRGLDNRHRHLIVQWAEINNLIDFSLKPEMRVALQNIQQQIKKLDSDRERLYLEYSI